MCVYLCIVSLSTSALAGRCRQFLHGNKKSNNSRNKKTQTWTSAHGAPNDWSTSWMKKCWITNISMFRTFCLGLGGTVGVLDDDAFLSHCSETTLTCKDPPPKKRESRSVLENEIYKLIYSYNIFILWLFKKIFTLVSHQLTSCPPEVPTYPLSLSLQVLHAWLLQLYLQTWTIHWSTHFWSSPSL